MSYRDRVDHLPGDAIGLAYDAVAESYAVLLPNSSFEDSADLALINRFVELLPGRHVLDAGCGAGRMMTHLLSLDDSLDVEGVDLSEGMVRLTRARHPSRRVEQGDLSRLPYRDGVLDGVLAWYSIIHSAPASVSAYLAEFARVLRPNGVVLVGFHGGASRRDISHAYGHDVTLSVFGHTTDDIAGVLRDVGVETVATLDRPARSVDPGPQGFVLGVRVPDAVSSV